MMPKAGFVQGRLGLPNRSAHFAQIPVADLPPAVRPPIEVSTPIGS